MIGTHHHHPRFSAGFTLVEMVIVAPIVIIFIGGFIYLLVNLTGEALSSRAKDTLVYDLDTTLGRINSDVATSAKFLATNDITLSGTGQGYGDTATAGSTTNFTNVAVSGGSPTSLVIKSYALNGNPSSSGTSPLFLANQPNSCSDPASYTANEPVPINIIYFVDTSGTLWRRTLMASDYSTTYCGSTAPWQQPSCIPSYVAASRPFCKTADERLISGVTPNSGFALQYYANASSSTAVTAATDASATTTVRDTALSPLKTVKVTITSNQTVAGRDISGSASTYATRVAD